MLLLLKGANARSRDAVGINGDDALLVSTSTSVKHSASLGDNTGERGDSNVSAQQQEVAAKQQKEEDKATTLGRNKKLSQGNLETGAEEIQLVIDLADWVLN